MRYFVLFDHDCRHAFLSDVAEGVNPADILGKKAWETVSADAREYVKRENLKIFEDGREFHHFGLLWKYPIDPTISYFFFVKLIWVGLPEVAYASTVWEFPADLSNLTAREREVLASRGGGDNAKETAELLGISVNTVHAHLKNIRVKLSLGTIDELSAFAGQYRHARDASGGG